MRWPRQLERGWILVLKCLQPSYCYCYANCCHCCCCCWWEVVSGVKELGVKWWVLLANRRLRHWSEAIVAPCSWNCKRKVCFTFVSRSAASRAPKAQIENVLIISGRKRFQSWIAKLCAASSSLLFTDFTIDFNTPRKSAEGGESVEPRKSCWNPVDSIVQLIEIFANEIVWQNEH